MTPFDPTTASRAVKAFALDERRKEKDAYDIHFVLRNHQPDVEALAGLVRPLLSNGLAQEGYATLKAKFVTLESVGPTWAATIAREQGEDFAQSQRSAFEYAQALFDATERTDETGAEADATGTDR